MCIRQHPQFGGHAVQVEARTVAQVQLIGKLAGASKGGERTPGDPGKRRSCRRGGQQCQRQPGRGLDCKHQHDKHREQHDQA